MRLVDESTEILDIEYSASYNPAMQEINCDVSTTKRIGQILRLCYNPAMQEINCDLMGACNGIYLEMILGYNPAMQEINCDNDPSDFKDDEVLAEVTIPLCRRSIATS